jgi:hypothetical protein
VHIKSVELTPFVRCFPHVVNIAVQTVLKEVKENPYFPVIDSAPDTSNPSDELQQYADALSSDPVKSLREIVAICRKSGQRCEELQKIIATGNASNSWGIIIRPVQLLRDCETRWSSTYNMVDHVIELYPVSGIYC